MSLISKAGKAAKFTVVTVPLGILGWNHNKKMFMFLRGFWSRSVNPSCPECDRGVLLCDKTTPTSVKNAGKAATQLFPWTCSDCQYTLYEPANPSAVRSTVALLRQEQAKATFTEMELAEREQIAKRHRLSCRIFYVAAAFTFANFIRLLMINAPLMFSVNWLCFAFMFWVFGMKRSYRAWQIANGHLFEKGAFSYWFKHGKWLI